MQQQNSQIIELKDRLVQALDEQSNVKDINEVNRIISILERTHVTRDDLEKTRLGKYINDLRRKTTDKELAKRAKKLIKTWRDLAVGGGGNNHSSSTSTSASSNNISTLTSPFNSNNSIISPRGSINKSYYDSKLTPPPGSSQHPALLRVKTQHNVSSFNSSNEKSKPYGQRSSLSPIVSPNNNHNRLLNVSQIASPKNATESMTINGRNKSPSLKNNQQQQLQIKRTILTPPPFTNGVCSPNLQNFKNIFTKETTVSPNNEYRRRTTPPTPNVLAAAAGGSASLDCSPNDSLDSFGTANNHKNLDIHDGDSNSSQLSNLSNDCSNNKWDDGSSSKRSYRKRKLEESENDSLRENINYVMSYGGRRPQSTQELIEKLNVNLSPKILLNKHNDLKTTSFSASSSPCISQQQPPPLTKDSSLDFRKTNHHNHHHLNGYHKKRNGFHSEDNSLDGFDNVILNKKLAQVRRLRHIDNDDVVDNIRENSISPDSSKFCDSYAGDEEEEDDDDDEYYEDSNEDDDDDDEEVDGNNRSKSKKSSHNSNTTLSSSKCRQFDRLFNHAQKIDQEIQDIYSKLPKVNPDDFELMQKFCFDNDDDDDKNNNIIADENEQQQQQQQQPPTNESEFIEEYEIDENSKHISSSLDNNDNETSFQYQITTNSKCDISKCDNNDIIVDEERSLNDDHDDGGGDGNDGKQSSPPLSSFDQQENSINLINNNEDGESTKKLVKLIIRKRRRKQTRQSNSNDNNDDNDNDQQKRLTTLIDRLENEQWEGINGNYDKDGVWHDFSEMTSSYVMTGGNNINENCPITEENVLHILPYVNCTW
ncbi:transcription coregulator [Dermatophagoides pteronyssinus]|uniref:Mediator of RNA polymerase II transcription subunit 26 n=1 Tax=Dermatophagoides pteronyssinus TaxID=6956 RepID=A0ABQ8J5I3_DERPT|nr:transcription coregulator [Dermatophagoides pteronyssinus]